MPSLVTVKGPNPGRRFPLDDLNSIIGRQPDAAIYLESLAVSRHHARIVCENGVYFVEDTGSSNGTYVNGHKIAGRVPLGERDTLQIGPYRAESVRRTRVESVRAGPGHSCPRRCPAIQLYPVQPQPGREAPGDAADRPRSRQHARSRHAAGSVSRPPPSSVPAGRPRHDSLVRKGPAGRSRPAHPPIR